MPKWKVRIEQLGFIYVKAMDFTEAYDIAYKIAKEHPEGVSWDGWSLTGCWQMKESQ